MMPLIIDINNLDAFFDVLVEHLRVQSIEVIPANGSSFIHTGLFRNFVTCLGTRREDVDENYKQPHAGQMDSYPGQITHIGDVPYTNGASVSIAKLGWLKDQKEINDKKWSMQLAIEHYFPEEPFFAFAESFGATLSFPGHPEALQEALNNILWQFALEKEENGTLPSTKIALTDALNQKNKRIWGEGTARKALVRDAEFKALIVDEPELMLSIAMYMAATIAWLRHIQAAADRNTKLIYEERSNIQFMMEQPFREFAGFFIFPTLGSLAAYAHKEILMNSKGSAPKLSLQTAIIQGWEVFMGADMLKTAYNQQDRETKEPLYAICPALEFLILAKNRKIIERLAKDIIEQKTCYESLLQEVKIITHRALTDLESRQTTVKEIMRRRAEAGEQNGRGIFFGSPQGNCPVTSKLTSSVS